MKASYWTNDEQKPAACLELGPAKSDVGKKLYVFFGWASE